MRLPKSFMPRLAAQLGRPSGLFGRLVIARQLNKLNRPLVSAAVDALEIKPDEVAVDIGFGGGVGLGLLRARAGEVHGVDLSPTMVERAVKRFPDVSVHLGSITELPLADASVDGAICINTVYFVEQVDRAFAEVARVLRPGGRFVLGIGDPATMADLPFTKHGFRIRPVDEVTALLAGAGLPVAEHRRVGSDERAFHLLITRRAELRKAGKLGPAEK